MSILYTLGLKGQCHEIFCFWFFYESVSPPPQSIPLRPFRIFSKIRGDIRSSRFATGDTGGKWKKSSIRKILIILFGHLWVVEETYTVYKFLPSSSLSGVCSLILFQLFATGVNDTGGKFAAGVVDTGGNLPPAPLTPAANLPPVSLTPVANLPPVSLKPVVHLDLRIPP